MPGPLTDSGAPTTQPTPQQTLTAAQAPDQTPPQTASPATPQIAAQPVADQTNLPTHGPSWGSTVYHGVLDALGGSKDVSLARDPNTGQMVATTTKSGTGTQWKRIIAGALSGFAGASQAKPGPGYLARAAGAGVQAGTDLAQQREQTQRQNANQDFEAETKAKTSQAQNALLTHQIAQSTFELGRAQVNAGVQDLDRENTFSQVIADGGQGSQDLGVFPDFNAVVKTFKDNPELHDHQAGGRIVAIPHIDADGKVDGVHAALVSPDWLNSKIAQDLPITVRDYENGKLVEKQFTIPAGSLTGDQYSKLVMAQSKDALDEYTTAQKEAQEQERLGQEGSRTAHENAANDATVAHENAETAVLGAGAGGAGTGGAPGSAPHSPVVDQIGRGQMPVGRMAYLLARNPGLADAVAQAYPGFDGSRIDAYTHAYKEFTSGSVATQLNAGATALQHLKELANMNTVESHIPGMPDYNAYMNKADTVSSELARFYGTDTIPGIAAIKKTLTATLPGNRMKAIQTQGQSMGDKFGSYVKQWRNAAPSAVYEANMPGISANAIAALKALDPDYDRSDIAALEGLRARLTQDQQPGAGQTITLSDARNLPHFKGQTDAQITAAAEALGYTVQ